MKKTISFLFPAVMLMAITVSCKKNTDYNVPASFTYVNAVVNTDILTIDFGVDRQKTALHEVQAFRYAFHTQYNFQSLASGQQKIDIYNYPDTTIHDAPITSLVLDVKPAEMFTLFCTGTKEQTDTMLIKEQFPAYANNDSSFSVRFLNLARGTNPVVVEVNGEALSTGISYKARTGWSSLAADSKTGNYIVQFRDQLTNTVLASYTIENPAISGTPEQLNNWRRNNYSIALIGDPSAVSGNFTLQLLPVRHRFPG